MVEDFCFTAIVAGSAFVAYVAAFFFQFRSSGVNWLESHRSSSWSNIKRRRLAKNAVYMGAGFAWASSLSLFWIQHENPAVGIPVCAGAAALIGMALWLATIFAGRAIIAPVVVASAVYAFGSCFQDANVLVGVLFGIFIGATVSLVLGLLGFCLASVFSAEETHEYDWLGLVPSRVVVTSLRSAQILQFDSSRRPDKKG